MAIWNLNNLPKEAQPVVSDGVGPSDPGCLAQVPCSSLWPEGSLLGITHWRGFPGSLAVLSCFPRCPPEQHCSCAALLNVCAGLDRYGLGPSESICRIWSRVCGLHPLDASSTLSTKTVSSRCPRWGWGAVARSIAALRRFV